MKTLEITSRLTEVVITQHFQPLSHLNRILVSLPDGVFLSILVVQNHYHQWLYAWMIEVKMNQI